MNARTISIISPVTGNGKTTVALNLGLALHQLGEKTIVIDSDYKPNMLNHLDIDNLPIHTEELFLGKHALPNTIYRHPSGLKIIPSLSQNHENLSNQLQDLDYKYIVLDTPETVLPKLPKNLFNEAIIVHSPKNSSKYVADAQSMLKNNSISLLGVLMNKSKDSSYSILDAPILLTIPEHKHIYRSYALKNPVVYTHPKSIISKKFMQLADMIRY